MYTIWSDLLYIALATVLIATPKRFVLVPFATFRSNDSLGHEKSNGFPIMSRQFEVDGDPKGVAGKKGVPAAESRPALPGV